MFSARDTSLDDADVRAVLSGDEVLAAAPTDGVWEPSESAPVSSLEDAPAAGADGAAVADVAAVAAEEAAAEAEARH